MKELSKSRLGITKVSPHGHDKFAPFHKIGQTYIFIDLLPFHETEVFFDSLLVPIYTPGWREAL